MSRSFRLLANAVLSIALLITGLAGCGGSEGSNGESALGACTPSEGAAGTQVVCEAGDIADGCTLFFGNTPVEYTLNDDGTVSFVVPPALPGERSVHYQCGDQGVTPLDKFLVPAKTADAADPVAPSDLPSDGEVIVPTEDAGPVPAAPETPETPAEPPADEASTSDLIATFEVANVSAAKLNTVKISWNFANAKSAYLWGDFNREASDTNQVGDARCGLVDGRHLVTGPDGSKLNEGSSLYEQNSRFLEGTLCDNANGDSSDDCKSQSVTAVREGRQPLYASRFDHSSATGDLFFYDQVKIGNLENSKFVQQEGGTLKQLGPEIALTMEENNPNCRIDLVREDATPITGGDLYTRSLVQHGRFCLAVEGADGAWTVSCKSVEAPKVALTALGDGINVSDQKPAVVLDFDYTNAVAAPEAPGCQETAASTKPDSKGFGHYQAECPINKDTMEVQVGVQGAGEKNVSQRSFRVEFAKPTAVMKTYGSGIDPDAEGEVQLHYKADRGYTILDLKSGEILTPQDARCPWVKGIELYGQYVVAGEKVLNRSLNVLSAADAEGVVTAYRDTTNYFWSFTALGFDGFATPSNVVHMDYESGVEMIAGSHTHTCSRELDWEGDGSEMEYAMWECGGDLGCWRRYTEWEYGGNHEMGFSLEVRNVKSLQINCWDTAVFPHKIKSTSKGPIQGFTTEVVIIDGNYPVVECRVDFERVTGEIGKIETKDDCWDHDYGNPTPTEQDVQKLIDETMD